MQILKYKKSEEKKIVSLAKQALLNEELVILPTDTVYGIMALASSDKAVGKLYKAKNRPLSKPTAVLVDSKKAAQNLIGNDLTGKLADKFWPGPLTIIKEAKKPVFPWTKIGVRVPDEPFLLRVLDELGQPVMASSANIAGKKAPVNLSQISEQLKREVSLVVDAGTTKMAQESTVIEINGNKIKVVRQGPILFDEINRTISNE